MVATRIWRGLVKAVGFAFFGWGIVDCVLFSTENLDTSIPAVIMGVGAALIGLAELCVDGGE